MSSPLPPLPPRPPHDAAPPELSGERIADALLGQRLPSADEGSARVGVLRGIPLLGLDALGSAAYGPEAALTVLIPLGAAGLVQLLPITLVVLGLLLVLTLSYRQTITAYPRGGGGYTVAKQNLGERVGLLAAAALMLDYVLNVAVGIAAGVGALVSALPGLAHLTLPLCLGLLALITVVNLRGVRESAAAFAPPTYIFIAAMLGMIGVGVARSLSSHGHPHPRSLALAAVAAGSAHPAGAAGAGLAGGALAWLLLRAFSSGCTAMTGVEAISNGVPAFADPAPVKANRTLVAIASLLGAMLLGIAYLARAYGITATPPGSAHYQSLLSQLFAAVAGRGALYYVAMTSVLAVLCISANTSFAGFPRLCRLVAEDGYLPLAFANAGRRLVYSEGIVVLAAFSGLLLLIFQGVTDRLIPLFAIGAFLTFTLSQAGMVRHWQKQGQGTGPRADSKRRAGALAINAVGAAATTGALAIILVAKLAQGAWVTLILIPFALYVFQRVKVHYRRVGRQVADERPIDLTDLEPPLVILTMQDWNRVSARALRFALKLSPAVEVVHIRRDDPDDRSQLADQWERLVQRPCEAAQIEPPRLNVIDSPYRRVFQPLLDFIDSAVADHPGRQIAVIVPELVESRWWQYLLHNQRATVLKARILMSCHQRVVVVNVPWYLDKRPEECR